MSESDDRVPCRTPSKGKGAKRIDRWKFDLLRKAILASLPAKPPGLPFSDLVGLVEARLSPRQRAEIGSIPWYATTVKLELEVAGEVARVPDSSPQRLVRVKK